MRTTARLLAAAGMTAASAVLTTTVAAAAFAGGPAAQVGRPSAASALACDEPGGELGAGTANVRTPAAAASAPYGVADDVDSGLGDLCDSAGTGEAASEEFLSPLPAPDGQTGQEGQSGWPDPREPSAGHRPGTGEQPGHEQPGTPRPGHEQEGLPGHGEDGRLPSGHVKTGVGGSVAPDTTQVAAGVAVLVMAAAGGVLLLLRRRASGAQGS